MAKNIKSFRRKFINLTANTVLTYNLDKPANLIIVRNPSTSVRVLFGDDAGLSTGRYQTFAEVDGGGFFASPELLNTLYFLATQNITRVVIEEYEVEDPSIFFPAQAKATANDVNVTSTVGLKPGDLNLDAQKDLQVDVKTMPNPSGVTALKVTAGGAGTQTVKATAGKVYGVRAVTANVTLRDNATDKFYTPAGAADHFTQPITCGTSIILNFSAAGDAYIIYE